MGKRAKKESFVQDINSSAAFHIQPKNTTQQYLMDCIEKNVMTVAVGPAGTGKTFCTGMKAAQIYLKGGYTNIVLTRANIPTGKSLGHFPGTVEEKMEPWLKPITSVLKDGLGKGRYEYMVAKDQMIVQPIETIRGNSFEKSIIIVDEAQNLCLEEIKAITTRIGENSKLILLGDPAQSDVRNGNDLSRFTELCAKYNIDAPVVKFTVNDIVRSDIVAQVVKMFYAEDL
jgi:phosphate starvation-inducible protein PhoH and related proteins